MSGYMWLKRCRDTAPALDAPITDKALLQWDNTNKYWEPFTGGVTDSFVVVDDNGDPWELEFENGLLISRTAYAPGAGTPIGLLLALTRI